MGIDIDRVDFTENDYQEFQCKLEEQLLRLQELIQHPEFGQTSPSIGAELELYIVDQQGHPLSINESILANANNPLLTPELNRYNLEYNLPPCKVAQQPFITLEQDIQRQLSALNSLASPLGGRMVPIGILPTLTKDEVGLHYMTQRKRYHALVNQLIKQRGSNFHIEIDGDDPIKYKLSDITLEGANTSFQIHYQVKPQTYADSYNALQLLSPLVVALGANSPTLFGHRLWHETRIPLFKQSIDTRHIDKYEWNDPARVNFGHGWCRQGAYELFKESVDLYPILIPILASEMEKAATKDGNKQECGKAQVPGLAELRLHQGTVWLWNRPVYDNTANGHLRIEIRALPSGPTAIDMMANAAFIIGLMEGHRDTINELIPAIPFQTAEYNFYRAAQYGLDAEIIWPNYRSGHQRKTITKVISENLPFAERGLQAIGIDSKEITRYLSVIEQRLSDKQNGARWQLDTLKKLNTTNNTKESLHKMLELFIENSQSNCPVAEWKIGKP